MAAHPAPVAVLALSSQSGVSATASPRCVLAQRQKEEQATITPPDRTAPTAPRLTLPRAAAQFFGVDEDANMARWENFYTGEDLVSSEDDDADGSATADEAGAGGATGVAG